MADQPYVSFPGLAGNYISTPDVNLLDADEAHFQQSLGSWISNSNAVLTLDDSPSVAPVFGTSCLAVSAFATGPNCQIRVNGSVPSSAVEYVYSVHVYPISTLLDVELRSQTPDNVFGGEIPTTPGQWNRFEITFTSGDLSTNALHVRFFKNDSSDFLEGEAVAYVSAVQLSATPVLQPSVFTPSLRIVGDLDAEMDMALVDWTPSEDYVLGFGWQSGTTGWQLSVGSGGLYTRVGDGSSTREGYVGSAPAWIDGSRYTVRFTFTASTGLKELFSDGVKTGQATVTPGAVAYSSDPVDRLIGAYWTAVPAVSARLSGDVYRVTVRDGIDGPIAAQFDAADVGGAT